MADNWGSDKICVELWVRGGKRDVKMAARHSPAPLPLWRKGGGREHDEVTNVTRFTIPLNKVITWKQYYSSWIMEGGEYRAAVASTHRYFFCVIWSFLGSGDLSYGVVLTVGNITLNDIGFYKQRISDFHTYFDSEFTAWDKRSRSNTQGVY